MLAHGLRLRVRGSCACGARKPILAAVGTLQFDVVIARLAAEYNVDAYLEPLPYAGARWVTGSDAALAAVRWPLQVLVTQDRHGAQVILFTSKWEMSHCTETHPEIEFHETAPDANRIKA